MSVRMLSLIHISAEKANEKLEAALESGEILTGKVAQDENGGLNVMYDETRVFFLSLIHVLMCIRDRYRTITYIHGRRCHDRLWSAYREPEEFPARRCSSVPVS